MSSLSAPRSCALFAACLGFALAVPAQCDPWSKSGLHRVSDWGPGSTLTVGDADSGPAGIAFTFAHSAGCGAILTTVAHRGTRADGTITRFDFPTTPPVGCPPGLWRARFRPVGSDTVMEVSSGDATGFELWVDDPSDASTAVLRWTGVEVCPDADFLSWAELCLDVESGRATWQSRLGRIARPGPTPLTLDEVLAPVIYTRQPTADARVLVPTASFLTIPAANLPMALWAFFGINRELEHPARGQQMQFSAVYTPSGPDVPVGDFVLSPRRKILYFSTEDRVGYYKRFKHRAVIDAATGQLAYEWAPIYFPTYGPAPTINYHSSRYPAVMCALEAKTDAFWYDVCEHYREFVDRAMGLTRTSSRFYRLNEEFIAASPFTATSTVMRIEPDLPPIFEEFVDQSILLKRFFTGADGQVTPNFMEWQKWLKGDPDMARYPNRLPADPIGPEFNPRPFSGAAEAFQEPPIYVRQQIERAHANDVNLSVYTLPLAISNDAENWPSFRDDWFLRDRDGDLVEISPTVPGNLVDYGEWFVPFWMATQLYDDIMDTMPKLGGVFLDVFSGGGAFLRYPENPQELFRKRYHGGASYVLGQIAAIELIRARIGLFKPNREHPNVPFIPSESVTEYLAGRYDFAQHGLKTVPFQTMHNRLFELLAGLNSPIDVANPSPPLWNAVYHEWSRAEGLATSLSIASLNGDFGGAYFGPTVGLSPAQWGDYQRMVYALWYFQGMKPTSFQYYWGLEPFNLLVERNGEVEASNPAMAEQVQFLAFLKRMHESLDRVDEAGQFLAYGRMERPLAMPLAAINAAIRQTVSPVFAVFTRVQPPLPGVRHFYENTYSVGELNRALGLPDQFYTAPHVYHTVWRSTGPDPKLGVVFVNWSDEPSVWVGDFDPSLYDGIGPSFTVKGLRPAGDSVTEYVVGTGSGPTSLSWNPAVPGIQLQHHAEAAPGPMPPRSIQVFVIE